MASFVFENIKSIINIKSKEHKIIVVFFMEVSILMGLKGLIKIKNTFSIIVALKVKK